MGTLERKAEEVFRPQPSDPETQINSEGQTEAYTERRKWPRFTDNERLGVWFSTPTHGAQHGRLEDIALGGICVCASRIYGLEIGQQVTVGIGNWMIPAKIRNMAAGKNNNYRVGMEWVRPETPAVAGLVERCQAQCDTPEQETM